MIYRIPAVILAFVFTLGGCGGSDSVVSPPANDVPILNASFDQVSTSGALASWVASEHNQGKSYTFQADPEGAWSAPSSAKISRYGREDFGVLSQQIRIQPAWTNKTMRLTAQLRTDGAVDGGAALILQMYGDHGDLQTWNQMNDSRVMQTQGWKKYSIYLKTLPTTYSVTVGIMLEGAGTVWADDLKLEIID